MNRRDRKKELTKRGLLDAGLQLFEKNGIYTTRVEDITEHADVAKGVFYNYFDSKFSLVAELLTDAIQALESSQTPPAKPGACFYEPLKAVKNQEPPEGGYSSSSSLNRFI